MGRDLKLLTALGTNKDLVLELVDFFNGGDRFRYREEVEALRRGFRGARVRDLYLLCTDDKGVRKALQGLEETLRDEYPEVRPHRRELGCEDVTCAAVDRRIRDLIYRETARIAGPDLVIASAGRKMVTQRLIEAGLLHGCAGYLAITTDHELERAADVRRQTERFSVIWTGAAEFHREKRARFAAGRGAGKDELGGVFRSLYLLPGMLIDRLHRQAVGNDPSRRDSDLAWLGRLPKADLHCHLGGCQDEDLLLELAETVLRDLDVTAAEREERRRRMEERVGAPLDELTPEILRGLEPGPVAHCLKNLDTLIGDTDPAGRCRNAAVLLACLRPGTVRALGRDGRVGPDGAVRWPGKDEIDCGNRLDWYMACGDLGGSTLLQTEGALRLAARRLMEAALAENVRCLEIRCSPENYTRAGLTVTGAMDALLDEARRFRAEHPEPEMRVNFLVMATRHKARAAMCRQVAAAVLYYGRDRTGPRVAGFDLAGQEQDHDPALFVDEFLPLHRNFIDITIHAGEMADEDKIWEAIYRLHAKRIGHGLKLIDNPRMMDFVRDHRLAIEMCPSSNRQTNSFRRFDRGDDGGGVYPLKTYLDHGIRVTVNTDNRAISATTLSGEYLEAARMTEGGLSRWDVLRLIRNGFKAAFLPQDEKDRLLKEVDEEVFGILLEDAFSERP